MPAGGAGRWPSLPCPDPAAFASQMGTVLSVLCGGTTGLHLGVVLRFSEEASEAQQGPRRGRRLFCPLAGWQLRLSFREIDSVTSLAQVSVS